MLGAEKFSVNPSNGASINPRSGNLAKNAESERKAIDITKKVQKKNVLSWNKRRQSIPLPLPRPDDLSKVYPINKWNRTKGTSFEIYIAKLFVQKGCPTERTPYHIYSGYLIVILNGVATLTECKQKPIVHIDTIQRTHAAKDHYRYRGVTHCMVITTGEFNKDAREEAQNLGVELMDGKQLLEEMYKNQLF